MSLTTTVRPARSEAEQQDVIAVITLAFSTDPMARWTFPGAATYLKVWPDIVRAFGDKGFAHGAAHLVAGGAAAAMWLPPDVHPDMERLTALVEQHAPANNGGISSGSLPRWRRTIQPSRVGTCR